MSIGQVIKTEDPHRQLYTVLSQMIADGVYKPHDKLPSERQMAKEHGLSQVTVNKTMKQLEARGMVYTRRGVGVFVSAAVREYSLNRLQSFRDWCLANGYEPETRLITLREAEPADLEAFKDIKGYKEGQYIYMVRQRLVDGKPAICESRIINRDVISKDQLKALKDSYFEFLSRNLPDPLKASDRNIKLAAASDDARIFLETNRHERVIRITGSTTDSKDNLIDMDILFYHPDLFEFNYLLSS